MRFGSHCSDFRTRVVTFLFLVHVQTLAQAFRLSFWNKNISQVTEGHISYVDTIAVSNI